MALDWERFDKDEGEGEPGHREEKAKDAKVENRLTLLASYGFSDRFQPDGASPGELAPSRG